ncbi:A/G-specific adenine glycosylase [Costertonia aggregata]|uniref:Adenine DNA glycosylase n=1 Tax=Costertonia aggregata TaxID=343403 RepID=A0A7H9AUX8_9FLAO|nr:A/G-specific adenine glycosylase [Costertonia aggregata]QLG47254.1 A/G-specific adenine glycosylase [Costertonia aggregata]
MPFSQKILRWYHENKRTLPWRKTKNPYNIWLSEIILQQTRVVQGTPYYLKLVENFPTVHDLAKAPEEKVLKLWQGLGYYSRARNLHAAAKMIVNEYDGRFPRTYNELLKLKGVGDYTASAIASICFNEPEPVVDGNVYRVLARYYGVDIPINSTEGIKYFKKLARKVMNKENVRDYNQGIMEFGAIQCAPKKPYCLLCPLNDSCTALQRNKVGDLPVKMNKAKVRNRYFNYLVPVFEKDGIKKTILHQRKGKGIWQNMWEFPLMESEKEINLEEIKNKHSTVLNSDTNGKVSLFNTHAIVHKLSHQHLHTKFWIVEVDHDLPNGIPLSKLEELPVPVLIADFIKAFKNLYF